ncbi:hypothetical protein T484DRAFT_1783663, partial [Baffinella frigidus]
MAASMFIDDNDLNPDYLELIVSWLDTELDKLDPSRKKDEGNMDLLDKDPFNDGKVYRAGSAGNLKSQGNTFYDPLSGKRLGANPGDDSDSDDDKPVTKKQPPVSLHLNIRDDSDSDDDKPVAKKQPPVVHIPHSKSYFFGGGLAKPSACFAKIKEFNAAVEGDSKLSDDELSRALVAVAGPTSELPSDEDLALLTDKMLHWPSDKILPALDITRALFSNPL